MQDSDLIQVGALRKMRQEDQPLEFYYGRPCKKCGETKRWTSYSKGSTGNCVTCYPRKARIKTSMHIHGDRDQWFRLAGMIQSQFGECAELEAALEIAEGRKMRQEDQPLAFYYGRPCKKCGNTKRWSSFSKGLTGNCVTCYPRKTRVKTSMRVQGDRGQWLRLASMIRSQFGECAEFEAALEIAERRNG